MEMEDCIQIMNRNKNKIEMNAKNRLYSAHDMPATAWRQDIVKVVESA